LTHRFSGPSPAAGTDWKSALDPATTDRAHIIALDVAARLRDDATLDQAIRTARGKTAYPKSVQWRPDSVSQGHAGLAILWSALDAARPDDGWDTLGFEHLQLATRAAETRADLGIGLSAGLGGLAIAVWNLSRSGTRYARLAAAIDEALIPRLRAEAAWLARAGAEGVDVSAFDVISGLAGVGRYLFHRAEEARHREALEDVLRALVALTEGRGAPPRWHTPARLLPDETSRRQYPNGNLNAGLAHGIPGPLALLSLTARQGVTVDGQGEAISRIADWILRHRVEDAWGTNWPNAVALPGGAGTPDPGPPPAPTRAAWCYGAPGISRALWLAGEALDEDAWRDAAIDGMQAVFRRPIAARQIDSPTFCHGIAGLLQITLRFANETHDPAFVEAARTLTTQVIDAYEPASLLGYRNLEPGGRGIDQPGLLAGAAGVALVLLAASGPVDPAWDALFLLS
jgi:lantibiotic modifying enzyme